MIYSLYIKDPNMKTLLSMFVLMAISPTVFGAIPYFDALNPYPKLLDDSSPGTFYYQFKATDGGGSKITYSLESKIQPWLEINADNGNTTVKKKIDREAMLPLGNFHVYATNAANEKGEQKVILQFIDVNNKPPIMTNIPFTKNVPEEQPIDVTLYTVNYVDTDDGINQQTEITIDSGNEDGTFRIENGKIILNKSLDYDNGKRKYILNITARNTEPPHLQTSGILTINVLNADDLGLKFTKRSYEAQVIKGSGVNTKVVQVEAEDLDFLNETAEYQIYSESNPGDRYAIDSKTGQITINSLSLELGSQTLVVLANSKKHGSVIALVNVTVVAVLNIPFQASVLEGQANVVVMDLTATESSFSVSGSSFSIESGKGKDLFEIDGTKLKVGSKALDREATPTYSIIVKLEQLGAIIGLATINIKVEDINDNSPQFQSSSYDVTVKEDLPVGSNVVQVIAMDIDEGANGTVKYSITTQQDLFSIDNSTGQITLSSSLDREKASIHVITVQTYDGGSPASTNSTNVTINVQDVNDNDPLIKPSIVNVIVTENAIIGSKVGGIVATDADQGQNAKISYSIESGADGHFTIDSNTGVITTLGQLSYKLKPTYSIVVVAKDNGTSPRSTNGFVDVSVIPVLENNHKPIFKSSIYLGGVFKETSDYTVVLTVSASDGDSGSNGEVQYQLITNSDSFFMDTDSGALKTVNSFADKEGEKYILTIQAKDKALTPKVSDPNARVYVLVLRESHSVVITAGVSHGYVLSNLQEFQRVLDDLTNGKTFIKSVRPGSDVNTTLVMFNVVDVNSTTEQNYDRIAGILGSDDKQNLITGKYKKWRIEYGRPVTGARTSAEEGLSAVVGAMICLAMMIGIGGIIMIFILIKKKRERERVRKAARVTFNDKPQFIDPIAKSMGGRKIENAQEAQEVIVHMNDEGSSVASDDIDHSALNYSNEGYHPDNSDDEGGEREENFYTDGDNSVHFGTFFPPPPTQPPPPVPDSEAEDSHHSSEEESIPSDHEHEDDTDKEDIHVVLPPHEDFADPGNDYEKLHYYHESPTHSVTDSTTNLVDPSSYKNSLLHNPSFGFAGGMRASINNDLTTEL